MIDHNLPFNLLRRYGASPLLWLVVPILLYGWSVTSPYVFDDLNLVIKTEKYIKGDRPALDLFRFAPTADDWQTMRSRGTYPWWSPESKRMDFFRPLPEQSFYLDVRLFARNPLMPRIESLILYVIGLLIVRKLYLAVDHDTTRAGIATFFLGISQCLTQPATFMANRSDLFVIIGVGLAATSYFKIASKRSFAWYLIGIAGFIVALLSKESAVALWGVLVTFVIIKRFTRTGEGLSQNKSVALYLILISICACVYLGYYVSTRGGNVGTASGGDSAAQILQIIQAGLLYAAVWTLGVPISLLAHAEANLVWTIAIIGGSLALTIFVALQRSYRNNAAVRFFGLWSIVMATPALLAFPESRALSVATIGWAWILTRIILTDTKSPIASFGRHWLLATNGIISVVIAVATIVVMNREELNARAAMREYVADRTSAELSDGILLIKEANSPYELICAGDRLAWITDAKNTRVTFLTLETANAAIEKISEHEWLIHGKAPGLFDSPTHRLTLGRAYEPSIGDKFELRDLTFEINELNDAGQVTAIKMYVHDDIDLSKISTWPPDMLD